MQLLPPCHRHINTLLSLHLFLLRVLRDVGTIYVRFGYNKRCTFMPQCMLAYMVQKPIMSVVGRTLPKIGLNQHR